MWSFFTRDGYKDFNYDVGSEIMVDPNYAFWKIHKGKNKTTGDPVTIFIMENTTTATRIFLETAKNSLKRIKTLRHPCILTYLDSWESDRHVYLVTESVVPLYDHLVDNDYTEKQKELAISWGLYQIISGLIFLHNDCNLFHSNICGSSIYVTPAGEWRIFGLEYVSPGGKPNVTKLMEVLLFNEPPEAYPPGQNRGYYWSQDAYGLGVLIWEIFNGPLLLQEYLATSGRVPKILMPLYNELLSKNPAARPSMAQILEMVTKPNGFLRNKFIDSMLFLNEIHIKDSDEKSRFFDNLSSVLDTFPQNICIYKILPALINAFEFGNAGSSILSPLFKLGKLLSDKDYQQKIVPCVVKMFLSKDRNTRVKLLQRMAEFIDHFTPNVVNTQIYPNVAQGFLDSSPVIREYTIKCMFALAPKLNYQNLNEDMLKHFARLQTKDEQGGIRTNTTVCLGKVATYLHPQTRKKVLINAFIRALRDPFPPARSAAILAFSATEHYYSINDIATRIVPALCHFTVDPEKSVREQAFKAIEGFLQKLTKVSEDPTLLEEYEKELQSTTPSAVAASWTSWAVTSLVDKLHMPSLSRSSTSSKVSSPTNAEDISKLKITDNTDFSKPEATPSKKIVEEKSVVEVEDWNTKEVISNDVPEIPSKEKTNSGGGEWDVDDWESFDIVEDAQSVEENSRISTYFPKDDSSDPFSSTKRTERQSTMSAVPDTDKGSGWDDGDGGWGAWDDAEATTTTSIVSGAVSPKSSVRQKKLNEDRLAREEKRKQKLKERQTTRPMKLGAQKIS